MYVFISLGQVRRGAIARSYCKGMLNFIRTAKSFNKWFVPIYIPASSVGGLWLLSSIRFCLTFDFSNFHSCIHCGFHLHFIDNKWSQIKCFLATHILLLERKLCIPNLRTHNLIYIAMSAGQKAWRNCWSMVHMCASDSHWINAGVKGQMNSHTTVLVGILLRGIPFSSFGLKRTSLSKNILFLLVGKYRPIGAFWSSSSSCVFRFK